MTNSRTPGHSVLLEFAGACLRSTSANRTPSVQAPHGSVFASKHLLSRVTKILRCVDPYVKGVSVGRRGCPSSLGNVSERSFGFHNLLEVALLSCCAIGLFSCAASKEPLDDWSARPDSTFVAELRTQAETDASNLVAFQRLGVAEYRRDRFTEASKYLRSARGLDPVNTTTLFFLALAEDAQSRVVVADSLFGSFASSALLTDPRVEAWIQDRSWNRALERAEEERTAFAEGSTSTTLRFGQVLVPDFRIESAGRDDGEQSEDAPPSLVLDRLAELAVLLADEALFAFADLEYERRAASDLELGRPPSDDLRSRWGRLRELGALGAHALERESKDAPSDSRSPADRLLAATGASAILQGRVHFDGSDLAVQWIWVELGSTTPVGPLQVAPLDSLSTLVQGLADELSQRPTLGSRLWASFTVGSSVDPDFGRAEGLVSSFGPGLDASRLDRIRARRAELERRLDTAEASYRRLVRFDPGDALASRGISRLRNDSADLAEYEMQLWSDLEPSLETVSGIPTEPPVVPFRSRLVDEVAASLCPLPLPDQAGEPADPRNDHLGADPVEEWINLGNRLIEPGIGDFPDPPGGQP